MRTVAPIGKYLLALVAACIPIVGQIILTLHILREIRSRTSAVLWIVAVWLVPYLGPLVYVLLGWQGPYQRLRHKLLLVLALVALVGFIGYAVVSALLH